MRHWLTYLAIVLFPLSLFSQDIDYARQIVNILASPEYCGRGYVENGNKKAAKYISNEFSKIGLKSFGKNFYQSFKINVNTFPKNMTLKFGSKELVPGKDFIVDPSSPSLKGNFDALIVKKQKLINDEFFKEINQSVKNKILIIDERDTNPDKSEEKALNERINYLKYGKEIESAGTIILTNNKLTWSNSIFQYNRLIFTVNSDIDVNQSDKISIELDAKFINYKTNNVIGFVEGTEIPDTFLVVTAHYDHLGKMGASTYFPGANDNASGVAMILSLAKYFKQNPPKYSVAFIALSAEEIGIIGAQYYTENPLFDLSRIKFLVNFDLAGTGNEGIKVVNGSVFKHKFDLLAEINDSKNLLKSVQIRGEACNSDHCMFYRKNVPCFYIYTLGGIQAYHDIYDKAETLPLTEFVDYSKLMIEFFNSF